MGVDLRRGLGEALHCRHCSRFLSFDFFLFFIVPFFLVLFSFPSIYVSHA